MNLPIVGKIFSLLAIVMALIAALFFTSCGTTKAVVRQPKDSTVTTISISTNNPISVDVPTDATINPK